jgi:hypothetical protein
MTCQMKGADCEPRRSPSKTNTHPPSSHPCSSPPAARIRGCRCAHPPSRPRCAPAAARQMPARSRRTTRHCGFPPDRSHPPAAISPISRNLPRWNADRQTRPGKRMPPDNRLRQAEFPPQCPHLILEQFGLNAHGVFEPGIVGRIMIDNPVTAIRRRTPAVRQGGLDLAGSGGGSPPDSLVVPYRQEVQHAQRPLARCGSVFQPPSDAR